MIFESLVRQINLIYHIQFGNSIYLDQLTFDSPILVAIKYSLLPKSSIPLYNSNEKENLMFQHKNQGRLKIYILESTPMPNNAKSYFTGSFASNFRRLLVNSLTACQSRCFLESNPKFRPWRSTCTSKGIINAD